MGSGLAHTLDPKTQSQGQLGAMGSGLAGANSVTSLGTQNYAVPSQDGRLLPAIPIHLALKFRPPTIAVVYRMQETKSGRPKKYIHEIKVNFDSYGPSVGQADLDRLCEDMCRRETMYLNPQFIGKQQVSSRKILTFSRSSTC